MAKKPLKTEEVLDFIYEHYGALSRAELATMLWYLKQLADTETQKQKKG